GVVPTDINGVDIANTNFPGTSFGNKSFFYISNDDIEERYIRDNRIVLALKDTTSINSMTPNDAETVDIKTDDGNPFKGKVVGHNEGLINGSNENDDGCTDSSGYNIKLTSEGCILEMSLQEEEIRFNSTFLALNPNFGQGASGEGDGTNCLLSDPSVYYLTAWSGHSAGEYIDSGSSATGVSCIPGYSSQGTPTMTCTNGAWEPMVDPCEASACPVPIIGEVGYENIVSWTNIDNGSLVISGEFVDETETIEGTCGVGYAGFPKTTCTMAPSWDALIGVCDANNCNSGPCSAEPTYYCGDNWNCSDGTCCNNNITGGGVDTDLDHITGNCYNNCTNTRMGNDIITNSEVSALGDCYTNCSNIMGDDIISNTGNDAYGDCYTDCSNIMGDDVISNTGNDACGDCYTNCSGIMGNDIITDTENAAYGDCGSACNKITQWATDIFKNTGSNSFTIRDFNAGGIDDKLKLPSGVTVSISGTGYSRTLTYAGDYSGTITIRCGPSAYHDCNALVGGSWIVKPCNVYVGGISLASDATPCGGDCSAAGFDIGTCSFND
ncbi:hypothetical protein ACFL0U_04285, partial [Pseudomonadota bacterium]